VANIVIFQSQYSPSADFDRFSEISSKNKESSRRHYRRNGMRMDNDGEEREREICCLTEFLLSNGAKCVVDSGNFPFLLEINRKRRKENETTGNFSEKRAQMEY
jgi:hypothetical protein